MSLYINDQRTLVLPSIINKALLLTSDVLSHYYQLKCQEFHLQICHSTPVIVHDFSFFKETTKFNRNNRCYFVSDKPIQASQNS